MAEADEAVQALTALRSDLLDQLASLREHLGQVDKLAASAPYRCWTRPPSEATRPVTDDFPVDPEDRPTDRPRATTPAIPGRGTTSSSSGCGPRRVSTMTRRPTRFRPSRTPISPRPRTPTPTRVDAADSDSPDTAEAAEAPSEQLEPADAEDVTLPHQSRGGFRAFAKRQ